MRKPLYFLAVFLLVVLFAVAVQAAPVEIAAPPDGSTVTGEAVDIIVNISSTDQAPVSRVEVSLDGKSVTERVYSPAVTSGNSVFRWNTTRTSNGKHTLGVGVFSGGNVVGNASCDIIVSNKNGDQTKPKVVIKSPKDGQVVSGTTAIIVESTDESGVDPFVSIYVDKGIRSAGNVRPYKYNWNTVNIDNGPHYISASATNDSDNSSSTPTIRVIVRNPVQKVPVAIQSQGKLPALPDMGTRTKTLASAKTNSTATPGARSSSAGILEASRNAAQASTATDKFEIAQKAPSKSASSPSKSYAPIPSMPAAVDLASVPTKKSLPAASTSLEVPATPTAPKTLAVAVPQGSVAASASSPSLMAKNAESNVSASSLSGNVLSTPAAPKAAATANVMPKSNSTSAPVQSPALAVNADPVNTVPSAASEARLSTPASIQERVLPVSSASKVVEIPALASAHIESVATVGTTDNRLTAPAVPVVKIPTAKGAPSIQTATPLLVAKLDRVDIAMNAKANVLSTPNAPKVEKPAAPAAKSVPAVKTVAATKVMPAKAVVVATKTIAQPSVESKKTGKPAVVKANRVKMVGIRPAFEKAGGSVSWDNRAKTVKASAKKNVVTVKIGSKTAQVNNQPVEMDKAATIREGRTMVADSFVNKTLNVSTK